MHKNSKSYYSEVVPPMYNPFSPVLVGKILISIKITNVAP
ncbi:hypothetical protein KSS87_017468, partial [Heliosperma pusillum]